MGKTLFWLHCGGCGGDTWSMFNVEAPNISGLFNSLDIDLLWHPTISVSGATEQKALIADLISGRRQLDFLCIEGAIIRGPRGTGLFDTAHGKSRQRGGRGSILQRGRAEVRVIGGLRLGVRQPLRPSRFRSLLLRGRRRQTGFRVRRHPRVRSER